MRGTTDQTMNLTRTLKKNSEADLFPAPDGGRASAITIETLKGESNGTNRSYILVQVPAWEDAQFYGEWLLAAAEAERAAKT